MAPHMKRQQDRAKRSGQSTSRSPGTAKRPPGPGADASRRPFSSPDDKEPVRSPRDVNKAPLPREQPTKQKARAKARKEERKKAAETPKPHNVRPTRE